MSTDAPDLPTPDAVRLAGDRREADPSVVPRSAVLLAVGITLGIAGAVVLILGWTSSVADAGADPYAAQPGRAAVIVGALTAVAGIAVLVVGVWRLAASVDYLAQREKDRERAA